MLRLILVPLFFAALVNGTNDTLSFLLFAIAASTDWVDGQIARRTGTVTDLGKAIDPLVDRLLIASAVVGLYLENRLPLWIVLVLLARDLYLLGGAWVLARSGAQQDPGGLHRQGDHRASARRLRGVAVELAGRARVGHR